MRTNAVITSFQITNNVTYYLSISWTSAVVFLVISVTIRTPHPVYCSALLSISRYRPLYIPARRRQGDCQRPGHAGPARRLLRTDIGDSQRRRNTILVASSQGCDGRITDRCGNYDGCRWDRLNLPWKPACVQLTRLHSNSPCTHVVCTIDICTVFSQFNCQDNWPSLIGTHNVFHLHELKLKCQSQRIDFH